MRFFTFCLFVVSFSIAACLNRKAHINSSCWLMSSPDTSGANHFDLLYECMQGDFSSAEQSKNDSDYFDIRLRMVPVWKKDTSVFYLYVEQAMATSIEKPYRQRFYKVEKLDDTHFVSHIFLVNNPSRFVGKGKNDPVFASITPDSLELKDGCEVYLSYSAANAVFEGATKENTCPSERSGAKFATAKVSLNKTEMRSWDQGWNADGKQVWGATKGGYIFKKQS